MNERIGRFVLGLGEVREHPSLFKGMFSRIVVLEAKYDLAKDQTEYLAYSDDFEKVNAGGEVPKYKVALNYINGDVRFTL